MCFRKTSSLLLLIDELSSSTSLLRFLFPVISEPGCRLHIWTSSLSGVWEREHLSHTAGNAILIYARVSR